jgi:hypothetical protein
MQPSSPTMKFSFQALAPVLQLLAFAAIVLATCVLAATFH